MRKPTLDTVAREVGVSRATVSNAYNRPDQLSASLRERIILAAAELGYAGPDPVARSLATRSGGAVAVMLGSRLSSAFSDPALTIVMDSLSDTLDADRPMLLMPGVDGGPRRESVARAHADIAVAYSLSDDAPALVEIRKRGLPLVVIDQPVLAGSARVDVADRAGAALAATHLRSLGHRCVGILAFALHHDGHNGPADAERQASSVYRVTRERLAGYLSVLGEAPVWETPGSLRDHGRTGAHWLLQRRPTALLCMSDELALGALRAAHDLGLRVPEDLSLVGFDDTPAAAWADPPLTTVRQDLTAKGRIAADLAINLLDGARPGPAHTLPTTLVERASTAPR
ncbi:LacI family DNA-binding transcriptional regulator [Actinokineospora sp. 24-640]